jgi:hypothetical protein
MAKMKQNGNGTGTPRTVPVRKGGGEPRNNDGFVNAQFRSTGDRKPPPPPKTWGGRRNCIRLIDKVANETSHRERFEEEMREFIGDHGMMAFYREWVFPLIPKDMVLKMMAQLLQGADGTGDEGKLVLTFESVEGVYAEEGRDEEA